MPPPLYIYRLINLFLACLRYLFFACFMRTFSLSYVSIFCMSYVQFLVCLVCSFRYRTLLASLATRLATLACTKKVYEKQKLIW